MNATAQPPLTLSCFSVADHYPPETYPGHRRTVAQLYEQLLEECLLAEELGYEIFFVAEHHFSEYGAVPNPAVWLAAAAARTRRIKLAPAVAILPFRNPIQVAEDYAMVDQLSGGRLVMGVGSGYLAHEFQGFGVDPQAKRLLFDEGLELLCRLWSGAPVRHAGTYHGLDQVTLNVRPAGGRRPPVYIAVLREEAAYHVGRRGWNLMTVPYATVDRFEDIGRLVAAYRRGVQESGASGDVLVALHTHVAETDAQARREAEAAFNLYVETRKYARRQTYDDIMRSGLSLMGGIATVADKLARLRAMGVDHVLALYNFGALAPELAAASLRRLACEVRPRVEGRAQAAS